MKFPNTKEPTITTTVDFDDLVKKGNVKAENVISSAARSLSGSANMMKGFEDCWHDAGEPSIVNIILPNETAINLEQFTTHFIAERAQEGFRGLECRIAFGKQGSTGDLDLHVYAFGLTRDNQLLEGEHQTYFPVLLLDLQTLSLFKAKDKTKCQPAAGAFIDYFNNHHGIIAILSHPEDKIDLTEPEPDESEPVQEEAPQLETKIGTVEFQAWQSFQNECFTKLNEAALRGKQGWNNPRECTFMDLANGLANQFTKHVLSLPDIANYLMMLNTRGVSDGGSLYIKNRIRIALQTNREIESDDQNGQQKKIERKTPRFVTEGLIDHSGDNTNYWISGISDKFPNTTQDIIKISVPENVLDEGQSVAELIEKYILFDLQESHLNKNKNVIRVYDLSHLEIGDENVIREIGRRIERNQDIKPVSTYLDYVGKDHWRNEGPSQQYNLRFYGRPRGEDVFCALFLDVGNSPALGGHLSTLCPVDVFVLPAGTCCPSETVIESSFTDIRPSEFPVVSEENTPDETADEDKADQDLAKVTETIEKNNETAKKYTDEQLKQLDELELKASLNNYSAGSIADAVNQITSSDLGKKWRGDIQSFLNVAESRAKVGDEERYIAYLSKPIYFGILERFLNAILEEQKSSAVVETRGCFLFNYISVGYGGPFLRIHLIDNNDFHATDEMSAPTDPMFGVDCYLIYTPINQ